MSKTIIHVDMDAFYAAVETRDNPALGGKPLIIGSLPGERGVVSTCNYEAREYGVRSAMSIQEAYQRCPHGQYMHPNMAKYKEASDAIHKIWNDYTDVVEYLSLDEGYLDVTGSLGLFGSAKEIARRIKERTKAEVGLTCSVGVGYSMATAKLASEEKKPDGYFEIPDAAFFQELTAGRDVRIILGVGVKSADKLYNIGVRTVQDIRKHRQSVILLFGKRGQQIVDVADGIDPREVTPYYESEAKSIGREETFQHDTTNFDYIKGYLIEFAKELSIHLRESALYAQTITLKITYGNMKAITRSKTIEPVNNADEIYQVAAALLGMIDNRPIRLVGISVSNFSKEAYHQLTLDEVGKQPADSRKSRLGDKLFSLQQKYGADVIRTGFELEVEQRFTKERQEDRISD